MLVKIERMAKHSAGIFIYRRLKSGTEVLIVHPGGPFWMKKDYGAWSVPKGEVDQNEELLAAAQREFTEELGAPPPDGDYRELGEIKQPSGKIVHAWAVEGDFNLERFKSNMFEMEWPPKSGAMQEFPENDRAAWVPLPTAAKKLVKGQVPLLAALAGELGESLDAPTSTAADQAADSPQVSLF
jgi:predicted NUDIX family NTP pyrophosphohydrolase